MEDHQQQQKTEQEEEEEEQYELRKVQSILDLEREVIESLTSGQSQDDTDTPRVQPRGFVSAKRSFSSRDGLNEWSGNAAASSTSFTASARNSSVRQSFPPPAWDDHTFQQMLRTDSDSMSRHSTTAAGPRRVSSTAELSTLAKLSKSGARQSAPPPGWNSNTGGTVWNQKSSLPIATVARNSSPAAGWTSNSTTSPGKLASFRTISNHGDSSTTHRKDSTVPSFRGVMASFRNFLSSSDSTTTTTPTTNNARVDVTPYFPHMFRRREEEEEVDLDDDDDDTNLTRLRLVKRNLPHFQSMNQVSIHRRSKIRLQKTHTAPPGTNPYANRFFFQYLPSQWLPSHWTLYQRDWFHILLRWPTPLSILFWSILWTVFIILFALIYLAASNSSPNDVCNLAAGFEFDFTAAFSFSLETAMTVGYTLPGGTNSFFEKCPGIQIAIYSQIIFNLILDGLLVTFLYTRISRAELRSTQLLFGNKALLRPIQYEDSCGRKITRWTLEVRVFDADAAHPICEAHVRIYASILGENQQLQVCRLLRPDDSLNGFLFTSVPYSIIHEIDFFSPLAPSSVRKLYKEHGQWLIGWNGLERRESDARNQTSYGWICPVCATTCGEMGRLIAHIKYMKLQDQNSGIPWEESHQRVPEPMLDFSHVNELQSMDVDALKNHLQNVEIICVVEGIDPITSGSFQALQSYTIDDLVFGGSFMPCVRSEGGEFVVDLDKFHRIVRPGYLVTNQMKDIGRS